MTVTVDGRVQRDADGHFERTHCVLHDITGRKASEHALRESERRLKLALDGARLGTFVWNPQDGAVRWSERQAELYGIDLAEFGGTLERLAEVFPDALRGSAAEQYQESLVLYLDAGVRPRLGDQRP